MSNGPAPEAEARVGAKQPRANKRAPIKRGTRAWQRMLSGRRLDLLDPSPFDIEIEDIAHGLARVARWNGQTLGEAIFSVAQHSVLVERVGVHLNPGWGAREQLHALLHDAAEYVIGDMISPFKAVIGDAYKDTEARIQAAVHLRFQLKAKAPGALKSQIKRADSVVAYYEAITLAGFSPAEAERFFGKPAATLREADFLVAITPQSAETAKAAFLARFEAIAAHLN